MRNVVRWGMMVLLPLSLGGSALADSPNYNNNNPNTNTTGNTMQPQGATTGLSSQDKKFLDESTQINMAEVKVGQMAIDQGKSKQVKDFGRKLMQDHQAALMKEKSLAMQVNHNLPSDVSSEQKEEADKLAKLSGKDFDRQFLSSEHNGHMKAISLFDKEVRDGQNPQVKEFAEQVLPKLRQHMNIARTDLKRREM